MGALARAQPGDEMEYQGRQLSSRVAGQEAGAVSNEETGANAVLGASVVSNTFNSAAAVGDIRQRKKMPLDPMSQRRVCYDHVHAEGGCVRWGCRYAHVACPSENGEGEARRREGGHGEGGRGMDDDEDEEPDRRRPRYVPSLVGSRARGGASAVSTHHPYLRFLLI